VEWRDLFDVQHAHVHSAQLGPVPFSYADRAVEGLTAAELRCMPGRNLNSIAWLLWHMARCEDAAVNAVVCERQQVLDDAWRRDLKVDRVDIGTGMTIAEVAELSATIDLEALLAYRLAVARQTRDSLAGIHDDRMAAPAMTASQVRQLHEDGLFGPDAEWVGTFWATKPLLCFLWLPTGHCYAHLGEAVTVRSQLQLGN
jgi:hypothetical protein